VSRWRYLPDYLTDPAYWETPMTLRFGISEPCLAFVGGGRSRARRGVLGRLTENLENLSEQSICCQGIARDSLKVL
jgi:hypothetical protein